MPSKPGSTTRGVILQPESARGGPGNPPGVPFFETAMTPDEINRLDLSCGGFPPRPVKLENQQQVEPE